MFGKSSPKENLIPAPTTKVERKEQSFLQKGVRIEGNITVEGDLRVEGTLAGTINVKNVLMIGPGANAEGQIHGGDVVIHGKVTGDVVAETRIQLSRGAEVTGDLYCRSLIIEEGVIFDGRSHMGEPAPQGAGRRLSGAEKQKEHGTSGNPRLNPAGSPGSQHPGSKTGPPIGGQERKQDRMYKSGRDKSGGLGSSQMRQSSDKTLQR